MDKQKYKKLAILLGLLWVVSVVIIVAVYFGFSFHAAQAQGLHHLDLLDDYAVYPVCVIIVYILPLLYFIQRFFYKAEMRTLGLLTRILWIYQCVCAGILGGYLLLLEML